MRSRTQAVYSSSRSLTVAAPCPQDAPGPPAGCTNLPPGTDRDDLLTHRTEEAIWCRPRRSSDLVRRAGVRRAVPSRVWRGHRGRRLRRAYPERSVNAVAELGVWPLQGDREATVS